MHAIKMSVVAVITISQYASCDGQREVRLSDRRPALNAHLVVDVGRQVSKDDRRLRRVDHCPQPFITHMRMYT